MIGVTIKLTPLLKTPPTLTTTFPVLAPFGTGTVILVSLQLVGNTVVPLTVTPLYCPRDAPKLVPEIVIEVPTGPLFGVRLVTFGGGVTLKPRLLLACLPTVTTTLPPVAPVGTGTTMLVSLQLAGAATVPLNVTPFAPCEAPKFAPAIVM